MTSNIKNKLIILIDGSFYIHRAYHAFPELKTKNGKPTSVIYGVINMITSLLIKYQPKHIAVIFDAIGKTFRNDLFNQYKANRNKPPRDLYVQIDPLIKIIQAMGLPTFSVPFVEADDVIGTLAVFYAESKKNNTILISSGDKDMAQIVSPNINLIDTTSKNLINIQSVEKKFGIPPNLIVDYLSLTGDYIDNIPGVPGIGKKTAQLLLNKIGNLKKIYDHLDHIHTLNIRNSIFIQKTLTLNKKNAFLSYQLAKIKTDVSLNKSEYELIIKPTNINTLYSLFKKYEFKKWVTDLKSGIWLKKYQHFKNISPIIYKKQNIYSDKTINQEYNMQKIPKIIDIIYNVNILDDWIKKIDTSQTFAFNIYTDTTNIFTAKIINICFSVNPETIIYIPIIDTNIIKSSKKNLCIHDVLTILKPIFESSKIKKINQNFKFNYSILKKNNINLSGKTFDIILELYVLYGTSHDQDMKHSLDNHTLNTIKNFKKSYKNYILKKPNNTKIQSTYAAEFINAMFNMHYVLWPKINKDYQIKKIFEEIETPLIPVLSRIENYGVLIDSNLLQNQAIEINSRLNALEKRAHQLVNIPFNLSSTKQLQSILYKQQKLPILKKTPKGSPSTNEEVLKKLSKKHAIPKIILQYRGLSKLKSTYTNKLITMINQQSKRIHTSYHQTRTSTGRLSSTNPNLQNIPNRDQDGRKIRQAFIAPKNFLIVSADYSQIELRIIAHLSHDIKLIEDFLSGKDIHAITASEIFVTKSHLVTNDQRNCAKTINFGLIYGMSAFGLARQLSVTCKEAQKYVDRYFQRYPGIMEYIKKIRYHANKNGYVSTIHGRKLYLPNIYSTNLFKKKSAERSAINAPMQGSASDIMKKAMISIDCWLQKNKIPARIIIQVHDELVFEIKNNIIDYAIKQIKKLMEECCILNVPLKVDIGIGKNWEEAH